MKFNSSAFVKLSTRRFVDTCLIGCIWGFKWVIKSPKDALTLADNPRLKHALMEELKHSDGSPNEDTCAFVQASRNCLRVQSGREAIEVSITNRLNIGSTLTTLCSLISCSWWVRGFEKTYKGIIKASVTYLSWKTSKNSTMCFQSIGVSERVQVRYHHSWMAFNASKHGV